MHNHVSTNLAFHASSVITEHGVILFAGDGGVGKSTIAGMLEDNGDRVPGDEVAFVTRDVDGQWKLYTALKKIDGQYTVVHLEKPIQIALVVFLRSHRGNGFMIEHCSQTEAVKSTFRLLFCDRQNDPDFLSDAFQGAASLFRQSAACFLDFALSVSFMPALADLLKEGG